MRASSVRVEQAMRAPRGFAASAPRSGPLYPADAAWPAANEALELQLLAAVNAHRVSIGRRPLVLDATLVQIAEWKARQMAAVEYMAHDDQAPPVARPFGDRFVDFGYGSYLGEFAIGENLAYAWTDVPGVMHAWLSDEGHKANIESEAWVACGMGVAVDVAGRPFWGQDFGGRPVGKPPTVTGIAPTSVAVGGVIVITGTELGTTRSVSFDPGPAGGKMPTGALGVVTATTVTAAVPAGAASGQVLVSTDGGQALGPRITVIGGSTPPPPPPPGSELPRAPEKWRLKVRPRNVITIDAKTTATTAWFRNRAGALVHRPMGSFLDAYERVPK